MTKTALKLLEKYNKAVELRTLSEERFEDEETRRLKACDELGAELNLIEHITQLENKIKNLKRKKKLDTR